jgi:hypothetical protein
MIKSALVAALAALLSTTAAHAGGSHAADRPEAIHAAEGASGGVAAFHILAAHAHRNGRIVTFHMTTAGAAGSAIPEPSGALGGAPVHSYVWPTSLDPATVGFEAKSGILALAATSHPDFDDTPLFDENRDGDPANDGADWHSHWVVLTADEGCPDGALGVRNIPDGATPRLPATWPGMPLYIDSPGYTPLFDGPEISVSVPLATTDAPAGTAYDGVAAALRVHASVHAPLLCVEDVFDVASGDLSLPGRLQ